MVTIVHNMNMPYILQQTEPVLREIAQDVPMKDITTPKIQTILKDMKVALDSQDDGVAIAAPQIGVPFRIFMISGAILAALKESAANEDQEKPKSEKTNNKESKKESKKTLAKHTDLIFINPVINKL